jgi:hypothetical protein
MSDYQPKHLADENGYPIVTLPGSLTWERGYEFGQALDKKFPGQDGYDLASAMQYCDQGPVTDTNGIVGLVMLHQGCNDEDNWTWEVTTSDGKTWIANGGCDYTGWDCQAFLEWSER